MDVRVSRESTYSQLQGDTPRNSQVRTHGSSRPSLESIPPGLYVVWEDGEIITNHSLPVYRVHNGGVTNSYKMPRFDVPDQVGIYELSFLHERKRGYKVASSQDSTRTYCTGMTNWTRRGVADILFYDHMESSADQNQENTHTDNPHEQQTCSEGNENQPKLLVTVNFQDFNEYPLVMIEGHRKEEVMREDRECRFVSNIINERGEIQSEGFQWRKSSSAQTPWYRKSRDVQLVYMRTGDIVALFRKNKSVGSNKVGTLTFLDDRAELGGELRAMTIVSQIVMVEAKKRKFHPRAVLARMFLDW